MQTALCGGRKNSEMAGSIEIPGRPHMASEWHKEWE
jgi:hypothetical protein